MRKAECLVERHARHGDPGPADLDPPVFGRVAERLGCVVVAVVEAMFAFMLWRKRLAIELADGILGIGGQDHPAGIVGISIDR